MTRVLKSNHNLVVRFPALPVLDAAGLELRDDDGNTRERLPGVTLPRGLHTARERSAGMIAYVELDDAAQARLAEDQVFRGMLKRKEYEWTEFARIPIELLPGDQQRDAKVRALEQENALLRSALRKGGLEVPTFNPGPVPVEAPDSVALAETDVSVPDSGMFGVDVAEPSSRPRFGADTDVKIPGTSLAGSFPPR